MYVVRRIDQRGCRMARQTQGHEVIEPRPYDHLRPALLGRKPPDFEALQIDAAEAAATSQFINELTRLAELAGLHGGVEIAKHLACRPLCQPERRRPSRVHQLKHPKLPLNGSGVLL